MSKMEMLKRLECLISFQTLCLAGGEWDAYDKVKNSINKLENKIVDTKARTVRIRSKKSSK
jgi:hypothetical protein